MTQNLQSFFSDPTVFGIFCAVIGLLVGSFLNVVIHRLPKTQKTQDVGKLLTRMVGQTLEAMGGGMKTMPSSAEGLSYRPELLQVDCDLEGVVHGLKERASGRLCLYGPPGTGKTAFGRYLSEVLDRPLLVKRASDLQSPYIGVAEKNMAKMFDEATSEGAVLLLDEADTFLQERQRAQRSWEISQVNEMLTQMESFEGIFIASTNLMESLDAASLRRFDLKIHFEYLKSQQAWGLFLDLAKRVGLVDCEPAHPALTNLKLLTPGDFANVLRQSRLRPIADAEDLVNRLRSECEAKPTGRKRAVGF